MSGFRHLAIQSFRVLSKVDLTLRPLSVIIGPNGSGKTSLLEALSLLAASGDGRLSDRISELGGFSSLLTYGGERLLLEVASEEGDTSVLNYFLTLVPTGAGYEIEKEVLRQDTTVCLMRAKGGGVQYSDAQGVQRSTGSSRPLESSLAQVMGGSAETVAFRRRLTGLASYRAIPLQPKSPIRLPQQLRPTLLPGQEGEDLSSCLYNLRESHADRFETVEDTLRTAFPFFDRLKLPTVAAGLVVIEWYDKRWTKPFYVNQLSEGTLRFLWLVALLQSPSLPALTMIDEPEVSMHPQLLSLLADLLREASHRSQIIVATQSDRLIRFLEPSEVLVADAGEDGLATFRWADTFNLDKWLEDYTLDEVWRMGRIGGRS